MSTELREQWEQLYLPLRPLCTNDFIEGVYRQPRAKALEGYRYIEANPKTVSDLLVVDIDDANARAMALWEHEGMLPNVIVENPRNGHAHAVWALAAPFSRTEYARRKPLALAAAVTEGLRRTCDGDKGYSGLMTKNPRHEAWNSELVTDHLYGLDELREALEESGDMPPASWKRTKRRNVVGLGRNCHLFETARRSPPLMHCSLPPARSVLQGSSPSTRRIISPCSGVQSLRCSSRSAVWALLL